METAVETPAQEMPAIIDAINTLLERSSRSYQSIMTLNKAIQRIETFTNPTLSTLTDSPSVELDTNSMPIIALISSINGTIKFNNSTLSDILSFLNDTIKTTSIIGTTVVENNETKDEKSKITIDLDFMFEHIKIYEQLINKLCYILSEFIGYSESTDRKEYPNALPSITNNAICFISTYLNDQNIRLTHCIESLSFHLSTK